MGALSHAVETGRWIDHRRNVVVTAAELLEETLVCKRGKRLLIVWVHGMDDTFRGLALGGREDGNCNWHGRAFVFGGNGRGWTEQLVNVFRCQETARVNGSSELPRLEDSPNVFVLDGLDGNMESAPELVGKLEGNEGVAWNIDMGMELIGSAWAVVSKLIMGAEPCYSVSYLQLQNH